MSRRIAIGLGALCIFVVIAAFLATSTVKEPSYGGKSLGQWLDDIGSDDILLVGFFTHMCVSTTTREALMRGLKVSIDPDGTGAVALWHPLLGELSADEVRRSALLHLSHMGARITPRGGTA